MPDVPPPGSEPTPTAGTAAQGPAAAPEPGEERPRGWWQRMRAHPLGRRLPLLVLVILGGLFWKSDLMPQERILRIELGPAQATAQALEIQVSDGDGQILARTEWRFPRGVPTEVSAKLSARPGAYQVRTFLWDGAQMRTAVQPLQIGGEESYSLSVPVR